MTRQNIFTRLPKAAAKEMFTTLAKTKHIRIERIVSAGQTTPKGQWLSSQGSEWVIVLKGRGRLRFENGRGAIFLKEGDFLFIPPARRHRVDWTDPRQKTVWLAVHASD